MTSRNLVTSTDYEHPYRPLPIRIFNLIGRTSENLQLKFGLKFGTPMNYGRMKFGTPMNYGLKFGTLMDYAKRKTGLADFGDDGHLHALEVLVTSINDEAELTATGRLIQKSRLTSALVQRLRIEELFRKHPEIHDINLGKIIMVTGLQRSGTTLLQRLLNANPDFRGVSGVEGLEPVSAGDLEVRGTGVRRLRAILAQRVVSYLSPQFVTVHPIDHNEPEEDVMLLDLNFMSQTPEATMRVPTYSRWLESQDHTKTYEYFRKVLKVLCRQRTGKNWVLKTPHHMEYLNVFMKVFPEATIIQTHRDPRKTLPSFCSMVAHAHAIFSDHVDAKEIARHWSRKTRRMVELIMQTRAKADPNRFVDVSYYDLMENPIAQLQRIYRQAGIDFAGEAVHKAEKYLRANQQNRFGKHAYRLSDFGLNEKIIEENFSIYRKKYAIPFE